MTLLALAARLAVPSVELPLCHAGLIINAVLFVFAAALAGAALIGSFRRS